MSSLSPVARTSLTLWPWRLRPVLLASLLVLALVLGWALFPSLFTRIDPLLAVPAKALQAPSGEHWFGTDHLGRDLYARTVHGAGLSLRATTLAVLIALLTGGALGLISGYFSGRVDALLMRLIEVLMAIPSLLLAMAVITVLGFGTLNIALAVGLSSVATFTRMTRGEVLRWRASTFVEAAIASGVGHWSIIGRHILPHAAGPVLALAALEFGGAVLAVSALSFLGFGAPPPQPEWGLLIAEGRNFIVAAWWYTTLPGLVVAAVVLAANQLARAMQKTWGEQR
ncbi:peptide/nickel transport system permease protein [Pseudomonas sp. BIGb0408]|uniref:Peptide/nickel transport system permease protein n=1 Tax=Phytopseudomonas flavescens TaxID=29435 RepID=A0A7Y9XKB2_9GAMM|nr:MULTISPECIES: ABC transporter permease [Pseudomonas]MCW2292466.1 peptide/nickel transport system permease protein [Pseudomonas sp. BIGb0408]NYH72963.1 peptide/nickel transport system permease protein [Pseudomonas flavescens]